MKKIILAMLTFLAITLFGVSEAKNCSPKINNSGETCNYRYELVLSKNDKVCKHMKQVFDEKFARPFDMYGFSDKQKSEILFPIYSHYPSSDEFEAVVWRNLNVIRKNDDGATFPWVVPIAEFDIDNDGEIEVVTKYAWFSGAVDSSEILIVYKKNEIDVDHLSDWKQLSGLPGGHPKVIDMGARIDRPFIFDGVSYLVMYESTGRGAFWGKQTMWIRKYKGGGQNDDESPLKMEDVCKFNMIRFD